MHLNRNTKTGNYSINVCCFDVPETTSGAEKQQLLHLFTLSRNRLPLENHWTAINSIINKRLNLNPSHAIVHDWLIAETFETTRELAFLYCSHGHRKQRQVAGLPLDCPSDRLIYCSSFLAGNDYSLLALSACECKC